MVAAPASFFVIRGRLINTRGRRTRGQNVYVSPCRMKTEEDQDKEMDTERSGTGQLNVKNFKVDRCPSV
ncbi:hypothetical protein D918_09054 [Trichuris suis]|nr:hypothetical protein D918_09054 [Trichuris suis]